MFTNQQAEEYALAHTTPENEVLSRLSRETYAKILRPRMLSGHQQGKLLEMISCMVKPSAILEIGTYTGYSAICLAKGLKPGGKLHTIDYNEELEDFTRGFFIEAGIDQLVDYHIGNALHILPGLPGPFDLVFIDADKENYLWYYNHVMEKMLPGGIILADNVLWSGKVFSNQVADGDPEALALIEFNRFINNDPRVENLMLPLRDGLTIMRKI